MTIQGSERGEENDRANFGELEKSKNRVVFPLRGGDDRQGLRRIPHEKLQQPPHAEPYCRAPQFSNHPMLLLRQHEERLSLRCREYGRKRRVRSAVQPVPWGSVGAVGFRSHRTSRAAQRPEKLLISGFSTLWNFLDNTWVGGS